MCPEAPIGLSRASRCILAAAALILPPSPVYSQDVFRQSVVVTASISPVELGTVTRAMTVITRAQLDALPVHSIADLLRLASSVDVRARGGRGVQTDFAVRGAGFGQMLVLVDGVRLNDAQSGHHNGDIPVPLDAVERIEILYGPGSSLFGADAFGGTINVVTRQNADTRTLTVGGGSFDLVSGRAQAGINQGATRHLISASFDRSSGFMYDRDFSAAVARARTSIGTRSNVSVAYLWKEFGANNFYGGNAPSREWTNQTLITGDHRVGAIGGWMVNSSGSYRTHGDRFLFDQERPLRSDNRHRTHAALATVHGSRRLFANASVAIGGEAGGEWIRSSNLGDHATNRVSAFAEWRQAIGSRIQADGAMRVDRYNEFGSAWSPSAGVGWWPSSILRLRASAGRAFRVPTFTERYYSDPANLARPEVGPERSWAGDGGADLFLPNGWLVHGTLFGRWDDDVIDWLRPTAFDVWRTYNIRNVETRGFELGVRRSFQNGVFGQIEYTHLALEADAIEQLSKYVLDYAPHSLTAAASLSLPARFRLSPRVEYRRRSRSSGTRDYVLLDARIGRRLSESLELIVEGTNLFDANYEEIAGVVMPGTAVAAYLAGRW